MIAVDAPFSTAEIAATADFRDMPGLSLAALIVGISRKCSVGAPDAPGGKR
jgi:hypothetical protein